HTTTLPTQSGSAIFTRVFSSRSVCGIWRVVSYDTQEERGRYATFAPPCSSQALRVFSSARRWRGFADERTSSCPFASIVKGRLANRTPSTRITRRYVPGVHWPGWSQSHLRLTR